MVAVVTTGAGVVLYSALHFVAFVALGILATWIVPGPSFWKTLARGGAFGALACSAVFYGGRALAGSPSSSRAWARRSLLLVNAMAGVIMAVVVRRPHGRRRRWHRRRPS